MNKLFLNFPIRKKRTIFISILFMLYFMVSGIILVTNFTRTIHKELTHTADLISESIAGISAYHIYRREFHSLEEITRQLSQEYNGNQSILGFIVRNNRGVILNPLEAEKNNVADLIQNRNVFRITKQAIYSANNQSIVEGSVTIYFSLLHVNSLIFDDETLVFLLTIAFSIVLIFLTNKFSNTYFLNPIIRIQQTSQNIALGKSISHLGINQNDEIGLLAQHISSLSKTLMIQFNQIHSVNQDLEIKVQTRTKALIRAEKIAILNSLIIGMAHEINTPIGNILLAATHLRSIPGPADNSIYEDLFDVILDGTNRMAQMTAKLRTINTDPHQNIPTRVRLKELLEEILREILSEHGSCECRYRISGSDSLSINTYTDTLQTVFSMLVENTLIHNGLRCEEIRIHIEFFLEDETVIIEYRNNGDNFDEEIIDRIYEPFATTNRAAGNQGIGMYLAYNLVLNGLSGTIEHRNLSENGICFTIRIPFNSDNANVLGFTISE